MFWNKKPEVPAEPAKHGSTPRAAATDDPGDFDAALDTITAVVRTFGAYAFDLGETTAAEVKTTCERMATELAVGKAEPGSERGPMVRDWPGVRRYFAQHRQAERDHVQRSFTNLRQAVQAFAKTVTRTITEDRATDEQVSAQLGRLVGAFQSNDTAAIRREAEAVARVVAASIECRKQREKQQLAELGERVQALRAELTEVRHQATMDGLTQVFNRAAFDCEIARISALGLMLTASPCLLMVDVDLFKRVNDRLGHPVGDDVLRKIADILVKHFLRKEDFVARYGGEEFAVILPEGDLETVLERANRARVAVRSHEFMVRDESFLVTISIGIAALAPGEEPEHWIEHADRALYAAKNAGRDRIVVDGRPDLVPKGLRATATSGASSPARAGTIAAPRRVVSDARVPVSRPGAR